MNFHKHLINTFAKIDDNENNKKKKTRIDEKQK